MSSGSNVTLSFGHPIDIFGNKLDEQGQSIREGRLIDIKKYFVTDGALTKDIQRNRVYSRYLASALVESYHRENVVLSSHVVTFTAFQIWQKKYPNLDIYALLALPDEYFQISKENMIDQLEAVQNQLHILADQNQLKLSPEVQSLSLEALLNDGLKHVNAYHFYAPVKLVKDQLISEDVKTLYYYSNRLFGYKLDREVQASDAQPYTMRKTLY